MGLFDLLSGKAAFDQANAERRMAEMRIQQAMLESARQRRLREAGLSTATFKVFPDGREELTISFPPR